MSENTQEFDYRDIAERSTRYPQVGAISLLISENPGKLVLLDADQIRIGRDESCDLRFQVEGVSRIHAQIERRPGGQYCITDLRSTNGLFVNGFQQEFMLLQDGDRVALGPNLVFCFRLLQVDEAHALSSLSASRSRDLATGAMTGEFFEEMLQVQLEMGQRRSFDVALITVQWNGFPQGKEEHRIQDLYAYLESAKRPGTLTARISSRIFAQSMSYQNRAEVEKLLEQLGRHLREDFSEANFFVGVAYSRDQACPNAEKLLLKATKR
ncbi:FHA domain-containing protein [bacterium]|nr:FHA domain-containing protein [bacterium]